MPLAALVLAVLGIEAAELAMCVAALAVRIAAKRGGGMAQLRSTPCSRSTP